LFPIDETAEGITSEDNALHPENAPSTIDVTLSGIM